MPSDSELLTQLMSKVDQLIHEMPMRYVDERRHAEVERRLDALEAHVDKIDETISNLHNSSMEWVNDMFRDATAKLTDESKAMRQQINDLQISAYRAIVMSIVVPIVVGVIVAGVVHFAWK